MKKSDLLFPLLEETAFSNVRRIASNKTFMSVEEMKKKFFHNRFKSEMDLTEAQICAITDRKNGKLVHTELYKSDYKANMLVSGYLGFSMHRVLGVEMASFHLHKHEKACLRCLAAGKQSKSEWQIGWMPFCLEHGCLLVKLSKHQQHMLFSQDESLLPAFLRNELLDVEQPHQYELEFGEDRPCSSLVNVDKGTLALQTKIKEELVDKGKLGHATTMAKIDELVVSELGLMRFDIHARKSFGRSFFKLDTCRAIRLMRMIIWILENSQESNDVYHTAAAA